MKYKALGLSGLAVTLVLVLWSIHTGSVSAAPLPSVDLKVTNTDNPGEVVDTLKLLTLLTVLSLAPAFLVMMTSFTRIVIVLSFVRSALGTQQLPPNQILIGLALFLTFFTMYPTYQQINQQAIVPYSANQIGQTEFMNRASGPLREFMLKQTREKDLLLFINMSQAEPPASQDEVAMSTLIPAFAISELKTAFQMGFYIFLPFLVIDIVVASTLMSMGMFMVSPVMISLPFKVLLFVVTDGWYLVVKSLMESFR